MNIPLPESPHFRNMVAILMGVMTSMIVVGTVEMLAQSLFPALTAPSPENSEDQVDFFLNASVPALLSVIAGWFMGLMTGCFVTGVLGAEQRTFCCVVLSLFCLVMAILVLTENRCPVWFQLAGPASLIPAALLGWWLAGKLLSHWKTLIHNPQIPSDNE